MNEIRPNQSTREIFRFGPPAPEVKVAAKSAGWRYVVLAIIAITIVAVGLFFLKGRLGSSGQANVLESLSSDQYSAVFLLNGQVYFGKMVRNDEREIVLKEAYYLQASTATSSTKEKKYDLVKVGSETYGPTSEVFITRSNVLFYETLRADSEVVKSIKGQQ